MGISKEELAKRFRSAREKKGYSLKEIVDATKLHPSVISALESGDYSKISLVYLKGFLKIYASFLGIDPQEAVSVLDEEQGNKQENISKKNSQPKERSSHKQIFKKKNNIIKLPWKKIIYTILAFWIGVMLFKFIFTRLGCSKSEPIENKNYKAIPEKIAVNKEKLKDKISVSVYAKREIYLQTIKDGTIVFEGTLAKGQIETWQAKKYLEFKISDGSSVDVEVNGELLPALSKIRRPIRRLKITAEEITIEK